MVSAARRLRCFASLLLFYIFRRHATPYFYADTLVFHGCHFTFAIRHWLLPYIILIFVAHYFIFYARHYYYAAMLFIFDAVFDATPPTPPLF